jgi:HEAT repeat protein
LLSAVANEKLTIAARADAARELGKRQERSSVQPLLRILSDRYDRLAFEIVIAVRKVGDPSALPALRNYLERARQQKIQIPGKLNAAIQKAIDDLSDKAR